MPNLSLKRSLSDFWVLIVPGLNNSGPQHWQSRWERLYPAFERIEQKYWDQPDLAIWSQRLRDVLAKKAALNKPLKPILLIAHSFGCLTTVHSALAEGPLVKELIAGALLVAPADPEKFGVSAGLGASLPFPATVVGSLNDPWMEASETVKWAKLWGAEYVDVGALGHINADSQLGDWQVGQALLARLVQTVRAN